MIEFKAECGHTIRAKDEDEGKVVRCSYCGRETQVPVNEPGELESLFSEVAASDSQAPAAVSRKTRRAMKRSAPTVTTPRAGPGFNPFAVAMKMGYGAAIIIVLIVVGNYVYKKWPTLSFSGGDRSPEVNKVDDEGDRAPGAKRKSRGRGLLITKLNKRRGGIYVNSVPAPALVRLRMREPEESHPTALELFRDAELETHKTNKAIELKTGRYDVVVAVKIDNPHLMDYPGYVDLRYKIDDGLAVSGMLDGFFMPDGATEMGIIEMPDLIGTLLYRRYEREVVGADWTPLTSQFLPYGPVARLCKLLPRKDAYGFDEDYVKRELDYYGIPERDQMYLVDALRRVGMVVYQVPGERHFRRLSLTLTDGWIVSTLCEDPRPPDVRGGSVAPAPPERRKTTGVP